MNHHSNFSVNVAEHTLTVCLQIRDRNASEFFCSFLAGIYCCVTDKIRSQCAGLRIATELKIQLFVLDSQGSKIEKNLTRERLGIC